MKRICKDKDFYKTVVLCTHFILHAVLFLIFMRFFGAPSVKKYLDMETIVISSEEQTNGIEAPAITFAALRRDDVDMYMGWKSAEQNLTFETFAMFNHCQGLKFTSMEDCWNNDTLERDEFLKSARLGFSEENSTSLVNNEASSSIWSEDLTATFLGRHFTLKLSKTLPTTPDGFFIFQLDNGSDYLIWLHDENFFIPSENPLGPPIKRWTVMGTRNENGLYNLITLTKQKKLNLDQKPCEEDPTYSFTTCTKEKLSEKIGCRLPWDRWSQQDRKICETENEFQQYEHIYSALYLAESDVIEEMVGCKKPCSYNEFNFVYSSPQVMPSNHKNLVGIGAA